MITFYTRYCLTTLSLPSVGSSSKENAGNRSVSLKLSLYKKTNRWTNMNSARNRTILKMPQVFFKREEEEKAVYIAEFIGMG